MDTKGLDRDVSSSISNATLSDAEGILEEWIAVSARLSCFFLNSIP